MTKRFSMLEGIFAEWTVILRDIRRLSPHTVLNYTQDVRQFLMFLMTHLAEEVSLETLRALTIQDYRAWLTERTQAGLSKRSNARALSSLRNFFRFLERTHGIPHTALDALTSPRLDKTLPRPVTVVQAQQLIEDADTLDGEPWIAQRNKALFTLLYGAGLRLGEALALNREHLTLDASISILGKGRKERRVPLLDVARQEIETYLQMCPYGFVPSSPLFVGAKGRRLNATMAQKHLQKYRRMVGLPDSLTPHALRHSFATHMLQSSGDLRAVQSLLGHASLSTTQIYTKLEDSQLLEAFNNFHPRAKK